MTVRNVGPWRGSKLVRTCINLSTPRKEWDPTGGKQSTLGTMRLISSQWAVCRDTNSITKLDITVKWSGDQPLGLDVVLSYTGQPNNVLFHHPHPIFFLGCFCFIRIKALLVHSLSWCPNKLFQLFHLSLIINSCVNSPTQPDLEINLLQFWQGWINSNW